MGGWHLFAIQKDAKKRPAPYFVKSLKNTQKNGHNAILQGRFLSSSFKKNNGKKQKRGKATAGGKQKGKYHLSFLKMSSFIFLPKLYDLKKTYSFLILFFRVIFVVTIKTFS